MAIITDFLILASRWNFLCFTQGSFNDFLVIILMARIPTWKKIASVFFQFMYVSKWWLWAPVFIPSSSTYNRLQSPFFSSVPNLRVHLDWVQMLEESKAMRNSEKFHWNLDSHLESSHVSVPGDLFGKGISHSPALVTILHRLEITQSVAGALVISTSRISNHKARHTIWGWSAHTCLAPSFPLGKWQEQIATCLFACRRDPPENI